MKTQGSGLHFAPASLHFNLSNNRHFLNGGLIRIYEESA